MPEKKKILSVAKTDFLRRTRQLALRKSGYAVWSAKDFNDIESLSKTGSFDIAVIGFAFDAEVKRLIAAVIRRYFPQTPIVELTTSQAEITDSIPCSPSHVELKATIRALLKNHKTKNARSSN
jgi:DNA-binding response OmpR family regulator